MLKILFVCTGNTCRSPLAASLLKEKLPEAEVRSAGIFAGFGKPASQGTIEVLKRKGIKLQHETQPVSEELLNWSDLVLTMTTQHKQSISLQYPAFQEKLFTLKEYVLAGDETDNWNELKKAYSDFEMKKTEFVQKNSDYLSPLELEDALYEKFEKEINQINQLEASQPNYDISDPFGGDLETYQATLNELENYIDLLINKISNT